MDDGIGEEEMDTVVWMADAECGKLEDPGISGGEVDKEPVVPVGVMLSDTVVVMTL